MKQIIKPTKIEMSEALKAAYSVANTRWARYAKFSHQSYYGLDFEEIKSIALEGLTVTLFKNPDISFDALWKAIDRFVFKQVQVQEEYFKREVVVELASNTIVGSNSDYNLWLPVLTKADVRAMAKQYLSGKKVSDLRFAHSFEAQSQASKEKLAKVILTPKECSKSEKVYSYYILGLIMRNMLSVTEYTLNNSNPTIKGDSDE